ncbi:MAG TPA: hypothetical protein VJT32_01155 [bacterium]|nr:hypothetical protein [bacterium]
MAAGLTLLHLALQVASIALFPAFALWAARTGGPIRLWRTTGLSIGLMLVFAATAASAAAGNALAPTYGYGYTAPRALLLYGLTLGLPMVSAGLVVHALAGRARSRRGLYAVGVICAALTWAVGVVAATWLFAAIA